MSDGEPLALAHDDVEVLLALLLAGDAAGLQHLAEHADERERGLQLVAHVGDELALERGDAALALCGEQDRRDPEHDDGARQHDHHELERRAVLHAGRELVAGARRDLHAPAVERRREADRRR